MAAYRRVYDSRHQQADCQEPESAPEPYGLPLPFLINRYRNVLSSIALDLKVGRTVDRLSPS